MADSSSDPSNKLEGATIPIAQLCPATPREKAVHGVVTIVWPYNSVKNLISFTLAEPEFRLRRLKGQARINFSGSTAKAISESGLGSGDKVQLQLEGVEFLPNETKARVPGAELEWQLNFSERVVLRVQLGDSGETKTIDIDHPAQPQPEPEPEIAAPPSPEPHVDLSSLDLPLPPPPTVISSTPAKSAAFSRLQDGEFESPAFKRARISYGSLFEEDIFEDDGGAKGRGRKRARFGQSIGSWRYTSQSPSPERSSPEGEEDVAGDIDEPTKSSPRPQMTDGACQTMELDLSEPPVRETAVEIPQVLQQPAQQANPFLNAGFVDQGHQTLPMSGWGSAAVVSQSPFASSGFLSSQEQAAPFGSGAGLGQGLGEAHQGWGSSSTAGQQTPYPELPLDSHQEHIAPTVEQPFATPAAYGFGGVVPGIPAEHAGEAGAAGPIDVSGNVESDHVHAEPLATMSYPVLPLEEPSLTGQASPAHPVAHVPAAFPFTKPGVPLAEETVTVPANPFAREGDVSFERAGINAGASSWASVNNKQAENQTTSRPSSDQLGSTDGQTPDSALVINESESEGDDGSLENQETGEAASSLPERAQHALSHTGADHLRERVPSPPGIREEGLEDEEQIDEDDVSDRYDDEYDEDDAGGDYDTRKYLRPLDDEDDGNDYDLRQHRLEPEFDDGEEEESYDEDEEEYDSDELGDRPEGFEGRPDMVGDVLSPSGPQRQPLPVQRQMMRLPTSAPVVIDLLSDSDDDAEAPPSRPVASSMPSGRALPLPSQPVVMSPEYGPESDEDEDNVDEEEDEDVEEEDAAEEDAEEEDAEEESDEVEEEEDVEGEEDETDEEVERELDQTQAFLRHQEEQLQVKDAYSDEEDASELEHEHEDDENDNAGTELREDDGEAGVNDGDIDPGPVAVQAAPILQSQDVPLADELNDQRQSPVLPLTIIEKEDVQMAEGAAEEEQLSPVDLVETDGPGLDHVDDEPAQPASQNSDHASQSQEKPAEPIDNAIVVASSPPATQSFQSQIIEEMDEFATQETDVVEGPQALTDQLPTPLDTQVVELQKMTVEKMEVDGEGEVIEESAEHQTSLIIEKVPEAEQPASAEEAHPLPEQTAVSPDRASAKSTVAHDDMMEISEQPEMPIDVSDPIVESHVDAGGEPVEGRLNDASSFVSQVDDEDAFQAISPEEDSHDVEDTTQEAALLTELVEHAPQEASNLKRHSRATSPELKQTPAKEAIEPVIVVESPERPQVLDPVSGDDTDDALDPSVRLAKAAVASKKGSRKREVTPEVHRPQTRSKSLQKSPTPEVADDSVQLAKASLNTPTKTEKADAKTVTSSPASSRVDEEPGSITASKLKLVRHLRDELPDCTTLKVLRQHMGKAVEVMAMAMMSPPDPQRAKGGPREYMMSFSITDHSIGPAGVAEVQLYRPHKESLPIVKAGDPVLLRNFTVVSLQGKGYGLRTNDGSSWAVFDAEDEPAQIKGPPVEYGESESTFAGHLREWFGLLDDKARHKLEKATQKIIETGKAKPSS
ncbi:hypothetical protein JX265_013341 [Neoarthrinium moseri]|uniref:Telomeric single stranded DNA binding POT1/Cdc13 domain-containing protein n=1 Tax=Neoarthrinium moseri TaxID=1658444 RepID=A0A9P9W8T4_9PEZI|nr:uncharacterized protein JN550_012222 [Neoarthrinium moseri]KAI1847216.1 hypothetical protein JX266_006756 [Neoarthrinium moseri]KAI1850778.1 hypothetical protein JX265_013341 [Neoarthrinium moseri]KAI1859209.1 hypothetical protein JN550_012222 [Neoarthrinium moseri]